MGSVNEKEKPKGSLLLAWQVKNKHCLVIGSGDVALSRIEHLVRAQAKITVITGTSSKGINPKILELNENGQIYNLILRDYETSDLTMYEKSKSKLTPETLDLISPQHYQELNEQIENEIFANVCCCIDDYELSTKIYYQCKFLRIPVNIADKPSMCDFYFGSMFNQDNLQIMISTNGMSPRLLKMIKDNIARQFSGINLNSAVENLGLIRSRLREKVVIDDDLISIETRMNWIKTLTDFFSLRQWSELELTVDDPDRKFEKVDKIISYFPNFPTKDYDEFNKILSS